ncbi:MAG: chromate transporter [Tissierellia bacterium]|nr:chromate transporter [Tissierellia bacterium]
MKKVSLLNLFITFLKINTFTFGGGYTIVPVIRNEYVLKKKMISDEDMLNLIAISQSGPGAMAVNASILTGYKLAGKMGAIVCVAASVLPPLIIISIVSMFYQAFSTNFWVKSALSGMSGVISAVLLITTYQMGKKALSRYRLFSALLMVGAFAASYFFKIHTGIIILFTGVVGMVTFHFVKEGEF